MNTKELLEKHKGHNITIWESTDWLVNLDENGKSTFVDEGDDGGFDETTPIFCRDCNEEITDGNFRKHIEEAVCNR